MRVPTFERLHLGVCQSSQGDHDNADKSRNEHHEEEATYSAWSSWAHLAPAYQMLPFQGKLSSFPPCPPNPKRITSFLYYVLNRLRVHRYQRAWLGHMCISQCLALCLLDWIYIMRLMKIPRVPLCAQPCSECKGFKQQQNSGPALEEFTRITNVYREPDLTLNKLFFSLFFPFFSPCPIPFPRAL